MVQELLGREGLPIAMVGIDLAAPAPRKAWRWVLDMGASMRTNHTS